MGEGGVDRAVFLNEMEWWEIRSFLAGLRRRERSGWQMMRMHAWMILSALGSKAGSPEDLLPFSWEHANGAEAQKDDEAELARMREWAEEWNKTH